MQRTVSLLILGVFLFGCGSGDDEEVNVPGSTLLCQETCTTIMRCDTALSVTEDELRQCNAACADPSLAAPVKADAIAIACQQQGDQCDVFMTCVEEARPDGDISYDDWCTAWCTRCSECYENVTGFGEGMCQDGIEADCLESCQPHLDSPDETCQRLFDLFNPETATCDEIDHNNPFDSNAGC